MSRRTAARVLLLAVSVVVVVATSRDIYGYWGGSGSGVGTGTVATTAALTLTPGTPATALYPGGQADVELTVSNPNAFAVRIGTLALDTGQGTGGFAVDAGHAGCGVGTLGFVTQTNGGAGWTVPAKVGPVDGTLAVTLSGALAMGLDAANACQGASTTVYLAAGP